MSEPRPDLHAEIMRLTDANIDLTARLAAAEGELTRLRTHTAAAIVTDRMERHEEFVEILERRIVQVADLTARLAERYQEGREDGIDFAREQVETAQGELMKALARLAAAEKDIKMREAVRVLLAHERNAVAIDLDTLTAAVAQARQHLNRYGVHDQECDWKWRDEECTCGLAAALAPPPGGKQ